MPLVAPSRATSAARTRPGVAVGGYTLIELLIGLVLGLVAVGALFAVYMSSRNSFRRDEQIAQVQENARFALDALTRDLQNGAYWGGMINSPDLQNNLTFEQGAQAVVPASGDCGPPGATTRWLFDFTRAFYFRNQANDTASPQASFQCLTNGVVAPNTDVLGIKRVATQAAATGINGTLTFTSQPLVLVTSSNGGASTVGLVMRPTSTGKAIDLSTLSCVNAAGASAPCQPQGGTVAAYRLLPSVYYVRTYTRVAGDDVPSLCRRVLQNPTDGAAVIPYVDECIATGVENMQVEWGVGTTQTPKIVDHYTSNPLASDFTNNLVTTARVHLLMRSANPRVAAGSRDGVTDDPRTYVMSPNDYSSSPDNRLTVGSAAGSDSFYRKLYTVTVQLKNAQLKTAN